VPFSGLLLSVRVVGIPRREKDGRAARRNERQGATQPPEERSQHNGQQRYWLFKTVFTENNQSEGIMAPTLVTNVRRADRRPLFPSRHDPAAPRRFARGLPNYFSINCHSNGSAVSLTVSRSIIYPRTWQARVAAAISRACNSPKQRRSCLDQFVALAYARAKRILAATIKELSPLQAIAALSTISPLR
jgi:hypothetical protein